MKNIELYQARQPLHPFFTNSQEKYLLDENKKKRVCAHSEAGSPTF
jgi:hypothetical protein